MHGQQNVKKWKNIFWYCDFAIFPLQNIEAFNIWLFEHRTLAKCDSLCGEFLNYFCIYEAAFKWLVFSRH